LEYFIKKRKIILSPNIPEKAGTNRKRYSCYVMFGDTSSSCEQVLDFYLAADFVL